MRSQLVPEFEEEGGTAMIIFEPETLASVFFISLFSLIFRP
jgi:hypothetical protein